MKNKSRNQINSSQLRRLRILIVLVFGVVFISNLIFSSSANNDNFTDDSMIETDSVLPETEPGEFSANPTEKEFVMSGFPHNNQVHSKLSCLICHRRVSNSARITLPGQENHTPCIGCHTQQFADPNNPLCTICHTNAETGSLKAFPPLRSFNTRFDHAKHFRGADCTVCHKPTQGEVAKSIPGGAGTHATCFQCHSSQSRPSMSSCNVCHRPGRRNGIGQSEWAKAFNVNFSHAKHNLSCTSCHTLAAGNNITAPLASMHFAPPNRLACASCHNNKRAFGGDDFSDCKRCHQGKTFKFPKLR